MLNRTHLAVTAFFVLILISIVEHKFVFVLVVFFAALIPDIDFKYSKVGRKKFFRFLQFFVKHRGIFHSFTFLALISLFFVLFFPIVAFPFFLGYGLHLFADSFTLQGIKPFYSWRKRISGKIRTGGKIETGIFVFFILADLLLLIIKLAEVFDAEIRDLLF